MLDDRSVGSIGLIGHVLGSSPGLVQKPAFFLQ